MRVEYLTLDEVLALHEDQLAHYGGRRGLRSLPLLESAIAMPQATFDGVLLHATLFERAAAYLFHLVQNHPFVDGNKRTGLMVSLVFLGLNGTDVAADTDELYELVIGVARGEVSKAEVALFLKRNARERG